MSASWHVIGILILKCYRLLLDMARQAVSSSCEPLGPPWLWWSYWNFLMWSLVPPVSFQPQKASKVKLYVVSPTFAKPRYSCGNGRSTSTHCSDVGSSSSPRIWAHTLPICTASASTHQADSPWSSNVHWVWGSLLSLPRRWRWCPQSPEENHSRLMSIEWSECPER